jgi:uncharacterized membrane protein YozB (DUF420 family)
MPSLPSQVNLVLQIAILILLSIGYMLKRRGNFLGHGRTMLLSLMLNIISFLLVMGPSLVGFSGFLEAEPLAYVSVITLLHAGFGTVAMILAMWVVASWRLRSSTEGCMQRKNTMRITIILWTIALLLGIWVYTFL